MLFVPSRTDTRSKRVEAYLVEDFGHLIDIATWLIVAALMWDAAVYPRQK